VGYLPLERIKYMRPIVLAAFFIAVSTPAFAQHAHQDGHGQVSPYAGQESRDIKSLSEEDIAALRRGEGWGLALPAELNGVPGPVHILELKDEIALSEAQMTEIELLYEEMRAAAIGAGERYVEVEGRLEMAFRSRAVTKESLRAILHEIEQSRAALRYIHLSAHLRTPAILTEEQIRRYNKLRGYHAD
jgi:hypothetical protein